MMMMHARDASGRRVSLLNDEPVARFPPRLSYRTASDMVSQSYHGAGAHMPDTPELLRSSSYDSNISSNDPLSPQTPTTAGYDDPRGGPLYAASASGYDDLDYPSKRPAFADSSRSNSYEDDSSAASPMTDRPGKRYPCRYRDSHGCEKTFTTSGHASRHSKIHTAEKAVQCTFAGCQKKFTRADNMKQHLETHYKDKSRSSGSSRSSAKSSASSLSSSAGRRSSSSGRTTSPLSRRSSARDQHGWDADPYPAHLGTPDEGAWDLRGLNLPLLGRPSAARTPSSGLDALAMAVACQEGA